MIHYEQLFNKYKNDKRKTWKTINYILQRSNKKNSLPIYFREGDCKITDTVEIVNKFNVFFTNIGQHLANKIKHTSNINHSFYLTGNPELLYQFQDINEELLITIIDKFPAKNSSGHDGVTLKQLKYLKLILIKPLTLLLNQIFNTGIFPDWMTIAKVIPIFKKDDETLFCNYMPIYLLPVISKVFEKVMHDQIY